jgi:glycerol-1-phosphate dehydrogenase [NAD(P)+]
MILSKQTAIPTLVRIKPGALDRLGIYVKRHGFRRALLFFSQDLDTQLLTRLKEAVRSGDAEILGETPVSSVSFEEATELFHSLPSHADVVIGFGGGKALDVAKYLSFLLRLPYLSIPTSLSNDGFCSPQSSMTVRDRRRSLPSAMPFGVVLDTSVCLSAPKVLWYSGVGDLVSKFTAIRDWKLAFHATQTPVDDFATLLSDASIYEFLSRPEQDLEGMKLLGSALLLNGISMSICGSSRPASGSEHLISHALDGLSQRPRLHGLQVGVATYLMSILQGMNSETIAALFTKIGFWDLIASDPFDREEWLEASRVAPTIKDNFYTVLSSRDCLPEIQAALDTDPNLQRCFSQ